jgi:shikimate 5-dehydrogenase
MSNLEYPFFHTKIPVSQGPQGFETFIDQYPGFSFCPYIAEKDEEGWDRSTSRVYMNKVLPHFLYVPVNISKGDATALRNFFEMVQDRGDIPAVNITQPHKSSPVLRELYLGDANSDDNVDTLIRNQQGKLEPYDLNSTAFVEWYKADVGTLQDKPVVLIGVGGVGEPIAKKIAAEHPDSMLLVDVADKTIFSRQLSKVTRAVTAFAFSLEGILQAGLPDNTVVINAAGKESAAEDSALRSLLQQPVPGGIFVDIRPHLDIPLVQEAKNHGWNAFTGYGMNARNDYVLLQGIARNIIGAHPPSFEDFRQLVADAS